MVLEPTTITWTIQKNQNFCSKKEANNAIFGIWFYCPEIHFLSFFPHFKNPYKFLKCEKQEMWNVTNKKQNFSTIPAIIKFFLTDPERFQCRRSSRPAFGHLQNRAPAWVKRPRGHGQGQALALVGVLHQRPRPRTMLNTCTPELQRALKKTTFEKNFIKFQKKNWNVPIFQPFNFFEIIFDVKWTFDIFNDSYALF